VVLILVSIDQCVAAIVRTETIFAPGGNAKRIPEYYRLTRSIAEALTGGNVVINTLPLVLVFLSQDSLGKIVVDFHHVAKI
jgi:hypothetical protein